MMTDTTRPINQPGAPGRNTGHGHVYRRPDGARARCGGPRRCSTCQADAARKSAAEQSTVTVDPIMLMYAFRYALGRRTYAVGDVADALLAHRDRLRPDWRQQTVRDIEDAIRLGEAGDEDDVQRWRRVADAMVETWRAEGAVPPCTGCSSRLCPDCRRSS